MQKRFEDILRRLTAEMELKAAAFEEVQRRIAEQRGEGEDVGQDDVAAIEHTPMDVDVPSQSSVVPVPDDQLEDVGDDELIDDGDE